MKKLMFLVFSSAILFSSAGELTKIETKITSDTTENKINDINTNKMNIKNDNHKRLANNYSKKDAEIDNICKFDGKDINGNTISIKYRNSNEKLLMGNPINKADVLKRDGYYNKSLTESWTWEKSYSEWRYKLYLNTCEAAILYAYKKKMDMTDLVYNMKHNVADFSYVRAVITRHNMIKLLASKNNLPKNHYYTFLTWYLAGYIHYDDIKVASKNFTIGIVGEFIWYRVQKNRLSLSGQDGEEFGYHYESYLDNVNQSNWHQVVQDFSRDETFVESFFNSIN